MQLKTNNLVMSVLQNQIEKERTVLNAPPPQTQRLVPALMKRLQQQEDALGVSMHDAHLWPPGAKEAKKDPLEYMDLCRKYLAKLDTMGWNRSYHQRLFHEDFLKACTRSFWKMEKPGQFARDHQRVLRANSWDHIAQEILISTPRRCVFFAISNFSHKAYCVLYVCIYFKLNMIFFQVRQDDKCVHVLCRYDACLSSS